MAVRAYTDGDLEPVLDVWYRASLVAHPFLSDEFLVRERREIAERWLPMADTVVAERSGDDGAPRVVGFLALVDTTVGAIFVDPDEQGRGVGRELMDDARARRPFLELDVFEENSIGRGFYAAYGFEVVGRHMNEVAGHPELRLRLGSAG